MTDSPTDDDAAELTFTCAICAQDAGMVAVVAPGAPRSLPWPGQTLVRWGPEGGLESLQLPGRTAARVAAALRSVNAARDVYQIHSPWMTCYCPVCDRCYCGKHWVIHGADGWCAVGHHRRMPVD